MDPTYWSVHGFGSRGGSATHGGSEAHDVSACEILDKRFAKGEITKEDYEDMKQSLGNEAS